MRFLSFPPFLPMLLFSGNCVEFLYESRLIQTELDAWSRDYMEAGFLCVVVSTLWVIQSMTMKICFFMQNRFFPWSLTSTHWDDSLLPLIARSGFSLFLVPPSANSRPHLKIRKKKISRRISAFQTNWLISPRNKFFFQNLQIHPRIRWF